MTKSRAGHDFPFMLSSGSTGWVELIPASRQSERLESPHRRRDAACKTMSAFRQARAGLYDRHGGAMLPFTDLSVDVALGVDGIVLPRVRHGGLL
ncbi:hypothetical protein EHS39_30760 [Ensifer sp. MPMI2T]|nr:hypothetical protein EHS39_30760 [Ensifer sp. MPMI2T]